jgi:hypothetical protein
VLEPPDDQLWRSVESTVRTVLLPTINDEWARVIAVQLAGMARLALTRPPDQTPARSAELASALNILAGNPIVAAHWKPGSDRDPAGVYAAVGSVLADAVSRNDAAGDEVRVELRSIVSRHLDDDLAVNAPLMPYFRGQLPDA